MGFNLLKPSSWTSDDWALVAAPFTGGASLALHGDVTGENSAREQNKRNERLQREANELSIELANTAHQREVEDYKKAGLNPILSTASGGAATPAINSARVENVMPGGLLAQANTAAGIVNTLASANSLSASSQLAKAQAINTQTDTYYMPAMKKAEIAAQYANAGNARAQADYTKVMKDVEVELKKAERNKINSETKANYIKNKYHEDTGTTEDMPTVHKLLNSMIAAMTSPSSTSARPKMFY